MLYEDKISKPNWKKFDKESYEYFISCINSTAEKIDAMMNTAEEISYSKLQSVIGRQRLKEIFSLYAWGKEKGLRMKDDFAVSYYRGIYDGSPAYIVQHSAIEYVFTGKTTGIELVKEVPNQ